MPGKSKTIKSMSDEKLMEFISFGNSLAFNELYNRYHKRLHYYFFRMLGHSKDKANDFLQDLFFKIIEKPEYFDLNRNFSTWIFSIAHNMCKNEYRNQSKKQIIEHNENVGCEINTEEYIESDKQLFIEELYKELDKLDESHKTVFILRHRENFGIKEISQIMNCAEGTVKSRLHYTSKKLAEKLHAFNPLS